MEGGEEIPRGFVVTCGNGAEMFDSVEETFDEMALAIECEIAAALHRAVRFGRNDNHNAALFEACDEGIGVITLAAGQGFRLDKRRQRPGLRNVMDLPGCEAQRQRIAKRIDDHMDFRREPAARAPDGLTGTGFFWAPALC